MTCLKPLAAAALAASFAVAIPAGAQTQQDPHHPPAAATTPQSSAAAPGAVTPSSGHPMMGMMMPMMGMHGGMSGESMPGMGMIDRIEGRIAFLRAELKVTDAQAKAWEGLAQAMRANAKRLGEARQRMMPAGQPPKAASLDQRLEQQEAWYAARLDGLRAIKAALAALLPALSEQQKKTAEELLPPHVGMPMGGGMGMMPMGGMGMVPMGGMGMMPMGGSAMPMRGGMQ